MKELLELWRLRLGLNLWTITIESIDRKQVVYPDDIGNDDYYIGVSCDYKKYEATIYHDVPLYEQAIIHELNHIRFPQFKCGKWNDTLTDILIKNYK